MNTYWKQSLWLGGIYWLISLVFYYAGTFSASLIDVVLSLSMLLFLIPMKWLAPVQGIDKAMKNAPITATLLVSIGWVPYFVGVVFLTSSVYAVSLFFLGRLNDYALFSLFNLLFVVEAVRQLVMILAVLAAVASVLIWRKSVVGCLGKGFRLSGDDACDAKIVEPAVAAAAKKLYDCKKETSDKKNMKVTAEVKKKTVKKDSAKTTKKEVSLKPVKKESVKKKKTVAGKAETSPKKTVNAKAVKKKTATAK